ncbi:MAG: sigma-70 family RNA polymerase sigma factor [Rhodanobacteraceae bacterium]|nr:sigma-70 family RNA polymerase sigma factor [Rhodanobacteraceae bacterium]
MTSLDHDEVSTLLHASSGGDALARGVLFARVYSELHAQAHNALQQGGHRSPILNTTALLHETYLRMVEPKKVLPEDKSHFFALAATIMRGVVVDHARRVAAQKRGGGLTIKSIEDSQIVIDDDQALDIVALDAALNDLERIHERLAKVVELRFFGGQSVEETASILGVTDRTIKRDWRAARALLIQRIELARSR